MKLQYLGDSRDAFKWDLLHWLCTQSAPRFQNLLFVPLLTTEDSNPKDGKTPDHWFDCRRPEIPPFLERLRQHPRSFATVGRLGQLVADASFNVEIAHENLVFPRDIRRNYWSKVPKCGDHSLVFLDPDNGFETETQKGEKWVRHREVADLVSAIPASSAVVVFQYRPQRVSWDNVFAKLTPRFGYVPAAAAVIEANLAFVLLARDPATSTRLFDTAKAYCDGHEKVRFLSLEPSTGQ